MKKEHCLISYYSFAKEYNFVIQQNFKTCEGVVTFVSYSPLIQYAHLLELGAVPPPPPPPDKSQTGFISNSILVTNLQILLKWHDFP